MVLTLFHDYKKPQKIFNCIKLGISDDRLVVVTVKEDSELYSRSFSIEKDYQRLTVEVD